MALVEAPDGFEQTLGTLPEGVLTATDLSGGPCEVIVVFARDCATLVRLFEAAARSLQPAGGLRVAWPKRASGIRTDLTEDGVRDHALAVGLVDNKVCAIDAVWSGLRCVYRVKDRPTVAPRAGGR